MRTPQDSNSWSFSSWSTRRANVSYSMLTGGDISDNEGSRIDCGLDTSISRTAGFRQIMKSCGSYVNESGKSGRSSNMIGFNSGLWSPSRCNIVRFRRRVCFGDGGMTRFLVRTVVAAVGARITVPAGITLGKAGGDGNGGGKNGCQEGRRMSEGRLTTSPMSSG